MKQNPPFVITISRQLGSGGSYVGQQLAKRLNIYYADREIISQAAKKLSVLEEDLESHDEKIRSFWQSYLPSYALGTPEVYIPPQIMVPTDRELFKAEKEIIQSISGERSAVIVGRCSSHILADHPNHVSIFLHADTVFRTDRIRKLYNVPEKVAGEMIARSDKERAHYNHAFTGKEWTDARQYSISLDTGKTGADKCIEIILKYLEFM